MTSCILPHQSVHRPEQTHHQWPPVSYRINQYTDKSRLIINDLLYLTSSISTQTRADSHQWPPVSYLINQYTGQSRLIINDLLYLTASISTQTRADSSSMTSCILPHQSVHRPEQTHHQWSVSYHINQYTDKSRIIINDLLYLTSSISTLTRADSSSMTSCILPHQSVHRPEQTHHQWPPVSYLINQYTDQSRLIINDLLYLTSSISTQTRADSSSMTSCILPHQSVHRPEQTHHQWPPVSYLINQYTDQSRLVITDLLYLTSSISTLTRADSSSMTSCILPHQSVHRPEQTHHQWPPVSYLINQYTDQSRLIINDLLYLTSSISTQTRADSSSMTSCILPHQSVHRPEQTHHQWPPVSYLINQYTDQSRLVITDLLYLTSSISTQTRADSSSLTSCILPHQSVHWPVQTHHQWPPVSYLINQYTDQSRLIINDLLYLTSSISTQTRADSSSMTSCILPHQSIHWPEQTHH